MDQQLHTSLQLKNVQIIFVLNLKKCIFIVYLCKTLILHAPGNISLCPISSENLQILERWHSIHYTFLKFFRQKLHFLHCKNQTLKNSLLKAFVEKYLSSKCFPCVWTYLFFLESFLLRNWIFLIDRPAPTNTIILFKNGRFASQKISKLTVSTVDCIQLTLSPKLNRLKIEIKLNEPINNNYTLYFCIKNVNKNISIQ